MGSNPTQGSSFLFGKATALGALCCFALLCLYDLACFFLHLSLTCMWSERTVHSIHFNVFITARVHFTTKATVWRLCQMVSWQWERTEHSSCLRSVMTQGLVDLTAPDLETRGFCQHRDRGSRNTTCCNVPSPPHSPPPPSPHSHPFLQMWMLLTSPGMLTPWSVRMCTCTSTCTVHVII